eukprot:jgi/Bigna1/74209/fgenesh1_pg.28_\
MAEVNLAYMGATKTDAKTKAVSALFRYGSTINLNGKDYFKSIPTCCELCFSCPYECVYPSVLYKSAVEADDSQLRLRHDCAWLPCCFYVWAYDKSEERLATYRPPDCCENPFMAHASKHSKILAYEMVVSFQVILGKFVDGSNTSRAIVAPVYRLVKFHEAGLTQDFIPALQLIFLCIVADSCLKGTRHAAVAFSSAAPTGDAVAGGAVVAVPLSSIQFINSPCFDLCSNKILWHIFGTQADFTLAAASLKSSQLRLSRCNHLVNWSAPLPSGYPGPDAFNNITTMLMTEDQARGFIGVMA